MTFYTYLWLREDGSPYYVGKGKGDRAWYSSAGHRPPDRSRIRIQFWPDEATALAFEIYQIDFWGRKDLGTGILRNMSDGGVGGALTGVALDKMKISRKGYRPSFETKAKTSAAMLGRPKSLSHVAKIRTISAPAGGRVAGRMAAESGQLALARVSGNVEGGRVQGKRNAENGHARSLTHIRWHVNRGAINSQCFLCVPVILAARERILANG
jgi:hypothetical protein